MRPYAFRTARALRKEDWMRYRTTGFIAAIGLALAFTGCNTETANTNNANANANANANVATTNTNANTTANANTGTRRAPTRAEYERNKESYQRDAKQCGR